MPFDLKIDPKEWQKQSVRWGHPIHSMCSYMASFPPKLPHYFIDRFTEIGDIVLDPFSGRGTTPTEACLMGRVGIGSDLNPIAYTLTKAKIQQPKKESLISRLSSLKFNFMPQNTVDVPDKIRMLYSEATIQQLLYLKNELNIENSVVDNFIMALILGGMHGDSNKPSYMSIPMPNTFSMSPNYVRKYINTHRLIPPTHDAFEVIRYRLERLYKEDMATIKGEAYKDDVRNISKKLKDNEVDLIFTSPPYLKVIKYGKLNWIRLWMLDIEPSYLDKILDDKHTVPKYMEFMKETINSLAKVMAEDALCFIVVGQVNGARGPGKNKSIKLGTYLVDELNEKVDLSFIDIIDDKYNKDSKVSRIWGREKKGNATNFDQILMLCKNIDAVKEKKFKNNTHWNRSSILNPQIILQK